MPNRKFTSCYNIKILNRLWEKIYVIFIELCMKGTLLLALKGNNSCKTHNIGIKIKNQKFYYIKHYKKIIFRIKKRRTLKHMVMVFNATFNNIVRGNNDACFCSVVPEGIMKDETCICHNCQGW